MALSSGLDIGLRGSGAGGIGSGSIGGSVNPGNVSGGGGEDELKTQFLTREGTYTLMTLSEYSRPNRVGYANNGQAGTVTGCAGAPVRVSFVAVPRPLQPADNANNSETGSNSSVVHNGGTVERITFNYGREIYVYPYRGVRKAADLTKPIDKRVYKGTFPTCHDFGIVSSADDSVVVPLIVGFSGGQIQLVDPIRKELSKLFNEERNIDKTRVTCIKWLPGSQTCFLASHASGHLYVYNYEVACVNNTAPVYQPFKSGRGFTVSTCKTKSTRNPLYKWTIGRGSVNEIAFSPCGHYLATASQDGCLRIFNYDTMELTGVARSYFGGLLCVCWSPDGKYVVSGGEDDLVTVYSVEEKRVVVRGQGHKSWVSVVAFDPYNTSYGELPDGLDFSGSDEEGPSCPDLRLSSQPPSMAATTPPSANGEPGNVTCYRFGSVGQDTLICLWDLTEDLLKQSRTMSAASMAGATDFLNSSSSSSSAVVASSAVGSAAASSQSAGKCNNNHVINNNNNNNPSPASSSKDSGLVDASSSNCSTSSNNASNSVSSATNSLSQRLASLNFGSAGSAGSDRRARSSKNSSQTSLSLASADENLELGTPQCPRIDETPLIEPLVAKKVAHERLTALVFREDCLVTACQDGFVCTWARPGKANTNVSNVMCPSSPQPSGGGSSHFAPMHFAPDSNCR